VDTVFLQKRVGSEYRTLQSIQGRSGKALPETILDWDQETKSVSLGLSRKEDTEARVGTEILTLLRAQGGERGLQESEISKCLKANTSFVARALRKLLYEDHKISRSGKGAKGDPFLYSISAEEFVHIRRPMRRTTKAPTMGAEEEWAEQ
jgi:hypothetical protein